MVMLTEVKCPTCRRNWPKEARKKLDKSKYKMISKYLFKEDYFEIKNGFYWTCSGGHIQPLSRLNCVDCD